jgi:phosphohistidine phosphatase SixA
MRPWRSVVVPFVSIAATFAVISCVASASARPASSAATVWGREGHRITARIAETFLTPAAKAAIEELIPGDRISDTSIAMWADDFKNTADGAHTKPWHYVDIPVLPHVEPSFNPSRDCEDGDCVITQVNNQRQILANRNQPPSARQAALRFLVHLVGDLHQPLHCAERNHDRGGNEVDVIFFGERTNLHSVWDGGLLRRMLGNESALDFADDLAGEITSQEKDEWSRGTTEEWALESHEAAVRTAYVLPQGHIPRLRRPYQEQCEDVVERQLKKGGVRLASILNAALAAPTPGPGPITADGASEARTTARTSRATTIILVRHAEKASTDDIDPPLSDAGFARAKTLARVLDTSGVSAVYATEFRRTQQTVGPLAERRGLTVTKIASSDTPRLVSDIRSQHAGQVVLVAGHSNTIPQIIQALGGGAVAPIDESDFGNMFIVTASGSSATVVKLRYGMIE